MVVTQAGSANLTKQYLFRRGSNGRTTNRSKLRIPNYSLIFPGERMNDRTFKHTEAHKLEDPERLKWLPPADVLARLDLREGMRVADVGAGTGYFSIPVARAIGASGRVFAVDLQSEMLDRMREKLEEPDAPRNISLHQGEATKLPFLPGSVDIALYANIWHELERSLGGIARSIPDYCSRRYHCHTGLA